MPEWETQPRSDRCRDCQTRARPAAAARPEQTELSDALGVTFQQVQKYERGMNRISAGRLFRIAEVLDVPVAFFFADFKQQRVSEPHSVAIDFDFLQTGGAMRLIRAYSRIPSGAIRVSLVRLAEALAGD